MKKIMLLLILVILLTAISGCTALKPAPVNSSFSGEVRCGKEEYTVTHNGISITTITYKKPVAMRGISYVYTGDELTIKYGELTYKPARKPPESNVSRLRDILCRISEKTQENIKSVNSECTVYDMRTATLTCSTDSGNLEKIYMKNNGTIYEFFIKEGQR